ncbi:MAG: RNase adapter RapZ [Alphaproteobacteria bacterium]|nr:RNase adapter RapZ [Alphaproteobacteria bacterium]
MSDIPASPAGAEIGDTPPLVVVTGLSGAGRSTSLKVLEDLGYEAVDNLPLSLLQPLLDRVADAPLAVGLDSRSREFEPTTLLAALGPIREAGGRPVTLLFVDCDDEVLARRFTETRRTHPLALDRPVADGIALERRQTFLLRDAADDVIETSNLEVFEFRQLMQERYALSWHGGMMVSIVSFSYKRGLPRTADLVFDVRFLRNPHYDRVLRPLTGRDQAVRDHVAGDPVYGEFMSGLERLIEPLLPRYRQEGKSYLTLAVGCTGGRHRSVTVAEELARWLRGQGYRVHLRHREIDGAGVPPPMDEQIEAPAPAMGRPSGQ